MSQFSETKVLPGWSFGCRDADRNGVQGLMLADDEVKPTLSDDQTNALTKAFKEADGFTYTIECGVFTVRVSCVGAWNDLDS